MSDASAAQAETGPYVLGHTDGELRRLAAQARLIDPMTKRFLMDGGIAPGMRVLDVGTGAGHVAFLAADIVGDSGEVVGVDRSATAVAAAAAGAAANSRTNVSFRAGDPATMAFEQPFDAVIGRYVLQFQADPAQLLRAVAAHVRPGGCVVFHELDWGGMWSFPPAPTHDQCCRWAVETIRLSGAETNMGMKLHATFVGAGLPGPSMRMEAVIGGGAQSSDVLHQTADLVGTLVPAMERFGVATAEEVDHPTLFDRMSAEARELGGVIIGRQQVGCWSRV